MRTNTIWKSLLMSAAMLISGAMTSCDKEEELTDFDAQISSSLGSTPTVSVAVEAGEDRNFTVTSNTKWTATVEDAQNILTLSKTSGNAGDTEVTATISANAADGDRATVTLSAMGYAFGYEIPVTQKLVFTVGGEPEVVLGSGTLEDPFTVAGAIAKAKATDGTTTETYYIKGIVSEVTEQFSTAFGNGTFNMVDNGSNDVFIAYRIKYFNNQKWVAGNETLSVGDEIIVCGQITTYSGKYETSNGYLYAINGNTGDGGGEVPSEEPEEVTPVTVAEFLALPESNEYVYELTGTVTGYINAQYGNFDLKDDTGTVYVYGLTAKYLGYGATNDQSYSSLGINSGDEIKIRGYRGVYTDKNGETKDEVMYAWFVEKLGEGSGGETPGSDDENIINKAADVKAGTYYLAGYSESYTNENDGKTTTYAPYSWHLWTGGISGNNDLNTVNYEYNKETNSLVLNPNLSAQDAAKGVGAKVEIESAGKDNTWYIKYDGKYLYSTEVATNRRMALGTSPAEWVFSDHANGGINITNNDVILGTAGATYDLLRSYKTPASTLTYGVALILDTVSLDGEPSGGEDPEEPTEGATIAEVYSQGAGAYIIEDVFVVSSNTQGYVISDSSNEYIQVFTGAVDDIPATGDKGTISGTVEARPAANGSYLQFSQGTTFEKTGTETVELGTPTEYDNTKLDEYANLTGTDLRPVYATFSGKLSISGNYYNVNIAGSSHTGSISYPSMDLSSFNGKNIKVTGFLIGYSASGTYINISANKVELGEESEEPDPEQPAPEEGEYSLVTAAPDTWVGEYVIGYANGTTLYTLKEKYSGIDKTRSTFTYETTSNYNGGTIKGAYNTVNVVAVGNYYALKYDQMYIGWTSSTGNSCEFTATTPTTSNTEYLWTLSIENGTVQITNVGTPARRLQFNANSGQERFAIYGGSQKDVLLFTSGSTTGGGTTTPDPVEPDPTANTAVFDFAEIYSDVATGSNKSLVGETIEADNISLVFAQGINPDTQKAWGTAPAFYAANASGSNPAGVRMYGDNTITITSEYTITKITFTFLPSYDGTGANAIEASEGEFEAPTWTGSTKSLVLHELPNLNSNGSPTGQQRFNKITIEYTK